MDTSISQQADNEGRKLDIKVYKQGRKCKKCKRLLSIYNEGPYCNVHAEYGMVKDTKIKEEKLARYIKMDNRRRMRKRRGKK